MFSQVKWVRVVVPWQTAEQLRTGSDLPNKVSAAGEDLRSRLWPLPVFAVVLALALGVVTPRLDAAVDDEFGPSMTTFLFGGGAGAARVVLGAIATSLVSVTSLTFSLTVLTLQVAGSQYSPRLLRTFARDRLVHVTLSLFLAAFVYALTVLRTVRSPDETSDAFVPQISVTLAFALAVASVLALVFFLGHLARVIRVETILRHVHDDARRTWKRLLRTGDMGTPGPAAPTPPLVGRAPLLAPSSGFIVAIDRAALLAAAEGTGTVIRIDECVGSALVAGTPIGSAWRGAGGVIDNETQAALEAAVGRALGTGIERTGLHDVGFGLRQLADVATRALSPGINDPTTAVHALNHSAALLCELLCRDLSPWILTDSEGSPRVVISQPGFEDLLNLAVVQPCHYGAADQFVVAALYDLLRAVAWSTDCPDHHAAVRRQLRRLRLATEAQGFEPEDTDRLAFLARRVETALNNEW